ncbi:ComEC family competence protein [Thalassoglobus neptunius]|uniref:ComEC family competence protein n=1 Tax=Thalassoglobus neptunius TaxID=1938619 RepID=A0A5C5W8M0_9PLAN|nr:DNA internalization-related competence protein ComEC/Rec2 [Thalassoglobus neptunius]TWT46371.1 ComEC family competence protein [Thalassoglobus neptunius]
MIESLRDSNPRKVHHVHRPALIGALAIGLGIALDAAFESPYDISFLALWGTGCFCLLVAASALYIQRERLGTWAVLLSCVITGAIRHHQVVELQQEATVREYASVEGVPVRVRGQLTTSVVIDEAEYGPRIPSWLELDSSICDLRVDELQVSEEWASVSGTVRVRVSGHLTTAQVGDFVEVVGSLRRPQPLSNPDGYDFAKLLRREGISVLLSVSHPAALEVTSRPSNLWWKLLRVREAVREECRRLFVENLSPKSQSLALSMLLGDRTQLTKQDREIFQESGAMHLLAISGLHVGILAGFVTLVSRFFSLSERKTAVAILVVTILYAGLTNHRPPVLRATLLICLVIFGATRRRHVDLLNALACCALVLLLISPEDLFDLGAQLSFLAVLAIIWSIDLLKRLRVAATKSDALLSENWRWLERIRPAIRWLVQGTVITATIWFVTFPLILSSFHIVAPIGLLLNLLLIPFAGIVLGAGYVFLLTGWFLPVLGHLTGAVFDAALRAFLWIIQSASDLPGGHFCFSGFPSWWLTGFYVLLPVSVAASRWPTIQKGTCVSLSVWCLGMAWLALLPPKSDELRVTVLDVGHGLAMVIELPSGEVLLYDAGNTGNGSRAESAVKDYLWSRNQHRIDAVLVSHADHDHFSGLFGVLDQFPVRKLLIGQSFLDFTQRGTFELCEAAAKRNVEIELLQANDVLKTDDHDPSIRIEILHPTGDFQSKSDNAQSLVMKLTYGERSLLLTGDVEEDGLKRLLSSPRNRCDILMSPHHGAKSSNPLDLLEWISSELLVVSTSDRSVGPRLRSFVPDDVSVATTVESGALTLRINRSGRISVDRFLEEPNPQ